LGGLGSINAGKANLDPLVAFGHCDGVSIPYREDRGGMSRCFDY
jgi:hypothetical protein